MRHQFRSRRDRVVAGLARISLMGVLALMGALFVGNAAAVGTPSGSETTVADAQMADPGREGLVANVSPEGLLIGVFVIGGGMVVLMVGAFKPPARERDAFADLLQE